MIAWPVTLPQSVKVNYDSQPQCGMVDQSEVRNPIRSRAFPEHTANFNMIMSPYQLSEFRRFWDFTLNQSAPFTAPWLTKIGFTFHFLRFTDVPTWEMLDINYWSVTLPVEIIAGVYP